MVGADTDTDLTLAEVRQIDRRIWWYLLMHSCSAIAPYPQLHGFQMFTGAELCCFEVETRAIVPLALCSTIHNLVLLFCLWSLHAVLAWKQFFIYARDSKMFFLCDLFAQCYLPLRERHSFRLHNPRDFCLLHSLTLFRVSCFIHIFLFFCHYEFKVCLNSAAFYFNFVYRFLSNKVLLGIFVMLDFSLTLVLHLKTSKNHQ